MIKIRKIRLSDYFRVCQLIRRTISYSFKSIYPPKLIKEFCKKYRLSNFKVKARETSYFVAVDSVSSRIIGVIGIKNNQLRTFFVEPRSQGKGIGRLLFSRFEKQARKIGYSQVVVEGGKLGVLIYKKFGFRKVKNIPKQRVGIHYTDVLMVKNLR